MRRFLLRLSDNDSEQETMHSDKYSKPATICDVSPPNGVIRSAEPSKSPHSCVIRKQVNVRSGTLLGKSRSGRESRCRAVPDIPTSSRARFVLVALPKS